eukprot:SAG11_NODE_2068_length_3864_cov_6.492430_5_plen_46_part_00
MAMADAGASRLEEASLSGSSDLDGEALDVVRASASLWPPIFSVAI